jgi:hypothetical protein
LIRASSLVAALALASCGCGYHVSGSADLMPKTVQTICVPAFGNATVKYQLTDRLPEAISREFITRTRYHIIADPEKADAVLHGTVINYISYPTVFDPATGRASTIQFMVVMQASLVERATGKVLYNAPNFTMKNQYEVATTARAYFEESDTALDRLSREVARTLVSSILENF